MSLELQGGYPVLLVDFGTGTARIEQKQIRLNDGETHRIDIILTNAVSFIYLFFIKICNRYKIIIMN